MNLRAGVFLFTLALLSYLPRENSAGAASSRQDSLDSISPVSRTLCDNMNRTHVIGPTAPVGCDRLRLVRFRFFGFDGIVHDDGQLVVMDAVARHVAQIFAHLRERRLPLAKARLMNDYGGSDDASMADNNTSAFNDRAVTEGTAISLHAYGLAIDLNPIENPFVTRTRDGLIYRPAAGAAFANRSNHRPWKEFRPGMAEAAVDIFADDGFLIWGGYWDDPIDYQHFEVGRKTAERLAGASLARATEIFETLVARYRSCRYGSQPDGRSRPTCIMAVLGSDPTLGKPDNGR